MATDLKYAVTAPSIPRTSSPIIAFAACHLAQVTSPSAIRLASELRLACTDAFRMRWTSSNALRHSGYLSRSARWTSRHGGLVVQIAAESLEL